MFKYLIPFLLLVTACSYTGLDNKLNVANHIPVTPMISEYEDNYISNILSAMGIIDLYQGEDYLPIKNIFIKIQSNCHGKGFLEYRQCMITELNAQRKIASFSDEIDKKIQLLVTSIEDEIRFIPHYLNLDEAPMPDRLPRGGWSDQIRLDCNIVQSVEISTPDYYKEQKYIIPIVLSYFDDFSRLEEIFPRWKSYSELSKKKLPKTYSTQKEDPCDYWTFGPKIGNIIYFVEKRELVYFFIKNGDGAGSGEFYYSIFAHQKGTQQFISVGYFQSITGFIPFYAEFYRGKDVSSENVRNFILKEAQNKLFLYGDYFWNERTHINTSIIDLLKKSLK